MMELRKKKGLLTILCCLLLMALTFGLVLFGKTNANADGGMSVDDIADTQTYGTIYSLPKIELSDGSTSKEATTILYKPDGTTVSSDSVVLNQAGKYSLTFVATINGKTIRESKDFYVSYPFVQFSGKNSVAQYVDDGTDKGLKINMATGGSATFNQIVDVSTLTASDVLFEMYVTPDKPGVNPDFEKFEFIMTDVYDESNYVTVQVVNTSENGATHSYLKAAASTQPLTGVEGNKIHVLNQYGSWVQWTFYGNATDNSSNKLQLFFDYESKIVSHQRTLIADLDSKDHFDTLWGGFTDGKVKISLVPGNGTNASFVVTKLFGLDLTKTEFNDTDAPELTVDAPEEIPAAEVGKAYPIFESNALDGYAGICDTAASVYLNYNSTNPYSIPVIDGAFTPTLAGTYTIKYTATDNFGNEAIKTINVSAKGKLDPISFEMVGEQAGGKIGLWIDFAEINVSGGSGEKEITFNVTHESGEQRCEISTTGFRPYASGKYVINYVATDYLGNTGSYTVEVEVGENPTPVWDNEISILPFMIEGSTYTLPSLTATDYMTGATLTAKIYVTDANGTKEVEGNKYVPDVNTSGDEVTINYAAESATGKVERAFTTFVYETKGNDGVLDMANYFLTQGEVTKTYASDPDSIVFATKENSSVQFINPLLIEKFEITFRMEKGNVGEIQFVLQDSENAAERVTIALINKSGAVTVNLNGESVMATTYKFSAGGEDIVLGFDAVSNRIRVGSKYYDVKSLPAFNSGYVYFGWNYQKVTGAVSMRVLTINSQVFSADTYDLGQPQLTLVGEKIAKIGLGATASTYIGLGGDVLDPSVSVTLTVTSPDNETVTDLNGVELKDISPDKVYQFVCDQYGSYRLSYKVTDGSGNSITIRNVIKVWDDTPPVITVEDVPTTVKVGKTVTLPTGTATDNVSGERIVYACIKNAAGRIYHVGEDGKFTFDKAGEYQLTYYAIDENGNMQTAVFVIRAK